MNQAIKDRLMKIMGLAYELNPTQTEQEITGDKPTVFIRQSGHTAQIDVNICREGWRESDGVGDTRTIYYGSETAEQKLDQAIAELEALL